MLKEGKSGEYAKKGHGARPFEDYVPIMFPCDGEVCFSAEADTAVQAEADSMGSCSRAYDAGSCMVVQILIPKLCDGRTSRRSWQPSAQTTRCVHEHRGGNAAFVHGGIFQAPMTQHVTLLLRYCCSGGASLRWSWNYLVRRNRAEEPFDALPAFAEFGEVFAPR